MQRMILMGINVFRRKDAEKISSEIKNKGKVIERACNYIFDKIRKAANEGKTSTYVYYGQSVPKRVRDETTDVTDMHLDSIVAIIKEAGYEVSTQPAHEETDNQGCPCCTRPGEIHINWEKPSVEETHKPKSREYI